MTPEPPAASDTGARLSWRRYGERGVLIELSSLSEVHRWHRAVLRSGLADEVVPGATTLFVVSGGDARSLVDAIERLDIGGDGAQNVRTHTVPVRYDGLDLAWVASSTGLAVEDVVARHHAPLYTVAFLGFSRGFAYLAGLDPVLHVARLAVPRTLVPQGSVAMGAAFTGVYPAASPGGWRLLGTTDMAFFDPSSEPPNTLRIGDRVRFVPVPPLAPAPAGIAPSGRSARSGSPQP